jgi:hypothetical protein
MTKVIVKKSHWLPRLCRADATTIGSTIYIKGEMIAGRLLVHECQHVKQWAEQGKTVFLLKYLFDYFRGRLHGDNHMDAYLGIGAEEDARLMASEFATVTAWSVAKNFPVQVIYK